MSRLYPSNVSRSVLLLLAGVLLSACASTPSPPLSPEQQVTQRAEAYWSALRASQRDQAYAYLAPAYRKLVDLDAFWRHAKGHLVWDSVALAKVECEGEPADACVAVMRVSYPPALTRRIEVDTHLRENWVRLNGEWWLLPEK
ncbi:hypothetical protein [Sedimenticola selenatireducens]|uniref:hypothetical protein n=1 Tax=Sedimenticola selenatireducens TaxID=191960 RepID=UPI00048ED125|nr:hypothetical protein [Sedimenticola selenatireducens]